MAVIPPNDDIVKLIEAFGFDANLVRSFDLHIEVDEIVTIKVELYPTQEEIEAGAIAWETTGKKYKLELIEE